MATEATVGIQQAGPSEGRLRGSGRLDRPRAVIIPRMNPRLLGVLSLAYVLLLLYASLMPFDFSADRALVSEHVERAWKVWPFGRQFRTSGTDVLSNLVLYVPLGALFATRRASGGVLRALAAAVVATAVGSCVSACVEAVQLLSLQRISSVQDWVINTAGAGLGAIWGAAFGRVAWAAANALYRGWRKDRPTALLAAGMCVMLAVDALNPYLPTIDVSQVKRNLRHSHIRLGSGLAEHAWHHWAVNRLGVYAVLSGLIGASLRPRRKFGLDPHAPSPRKSALADWAKAAGYAAAFAAASEAVKPFIVARWANIANVLTASCGAVVGALLGAAFSGRLSFRGKLILAAVLLAGYLTYQQWSPLTFVWNPQQARAKVPVGLEWLPLYHYGMSGRLMDAGLFLRTILLSGALAYVACLGGWFDRGGTGWRIAQAAATTGLLGLILEGGQFFLPARIPSVTDVFCYALGGALGCWACLRTAGAIATQQTRRCSR